MTELQAHLEIMSGIIRVYSYGSYGEKSPFDLAVSIVCDGDRATLKALRSDRGFSRDQHHAIADCLRLHGFRTAAWDRFKRIDDRLVIVRGEVSLS